MTKRLDNRLAALEAESDAALAAQLGPILAAAGVELIPPGGAIDGPALTVSEVMARVQAAVDAGDMSGLSDGELNALVGSGPDGDMLRAATNAQLEAIVSARNTRELDAALAAIGIK